MPITGMIPLPESPEDSLLSGAATSQNILSNILAGKQNQQRLAQQALESQQLNQYRNAQLGLERQRLGQEQQFIPLKLDLLRAQVEAKKKTKANGRFV